jgi:hypothetical protein
MSGWHPSRPPWETQDQPALQPDGAWYGPQEGPRVTIRPHEQSARGAHLRYTEPPRQRSRALALAGVIFGLAASVGVAAAAVQLTRVSWGAAPAAASASASAAATPAATPAASAPAPATTPGNHAVNGAGTSAAYVLSAPATAGGYPRTTPVSPAVQAIGTAGATQLMTAVQAGGGKTASSVTGQYRILGDQFLGYAGYTGKFTPALVLRDFSLGAANVTAEAAGPHGGQLACGQVSVTTPAASAGEACVWATTTTVGLVEFYGNGGSALEAVPASKAALDALKFRADVEAAKR